MNIFETKKIYDNFKLNAGRIGPKMVCIMGHIIGGQKPVLVDTRFGVTVMLRKHVET